MTTPTVSHRTSHKTTIRGWHDLAQVVQKHEHAIADEIERLDKTITEINEAVSQLVESIRVISARVDLLENTNQTLRRQVAELRRESH